VECVSSPCLNRALEQEFETKVVNAEPQLSRDHMDLSFLGSVVPKHQMDEIRVEAPPLLEHANGKLQMGMQSIEDQERPKPSEESQASLRSKHARFNCSLTPGSYQQEEWSQIALLCTRTGVGPDSPEVLTEDHQASGSSSVGSCLADTRVGLRQPRSILSRKARKLPTNKQKLASVFKPSIATPRALALFSRASFGLSSTAEVSSKVLQTRGHALLRGRGL
jgi:hypothetical protein